MWADPSTRRWRVSHDEPLGDDDNCVKASTPAQLSTGDRNQDLASCLDDRGAPPGQESSATE